MHKKTREWAEGVLGVNLETSQVYGSNRTDPQLNVFILIYNVFNIIYLFWEVRQKMHNEDKHE